MDATAHDSTQHTAQPIPFKAETRQLLDILIHSLYTEREIFLRELISNASDALTRIDFEILTNRSVLDSSAELGIWITADTQENTLTIRDTGIGMTAEEMVQNLGTIAHSGAREFIHAFQESAKHPAEGRSLSDMIGQFGVGFYSVFMVAEWVRVTSRSHLPEAEAATWMCTGADTFTVEVAEKADRGTVVTIKLKEDASEFAQDHRLRQIIRRHSDFIPFPIYLGEKAEQVNRQTAIWRQSPRQVEQKDYEEFYRQLTLEVDPPLVHAHMMVDAPAQMYAILYIPASQERGMFSLRREPGLKLYARKVLIQEYNRDLLPEYLEFVQGVVDSEDLPLNVSRESVQSNRIMAQLKKLVTSKVLDTLRKLAVDDPSKYNQFWAGYARYLKQGVAMEPEEPEGLYSLLRFHTTTHPGEWSSLDDYLQRMPPGQEQIYYIVGDDERSVLYSPHLDVVRRAGYEVLIMADPLDAFMLVRLTQYKEHKLANVADADLKLPETPGQEPESEEAPQVEMEALVGRIRQHLGDQVSDVRLTTRLTDSPARLVDPQGAPNPEMQRVMRLLNQEFETPKKVLELNPHHPILQRLNALPEPSPLAGLIIDQIYEDALLIEGLHPDPAGMIQRIQKLMEAALEIKP
ncbi:MAG: molecular chaperone Hsp90 [Chloroflexi bacterium]|nr:molecular chaperone Hsp90 [Chloroflexota bacterium]